MEPIESLEKKARILDLSQSDRSKILEAVINYTNRYLNELPGLPGYTRGNFDQLSGSKISEHGVPMDSILNILKSEVDAIGIAGSSGRHMGFIPGGGLWTSAVADLLSDISNKYSGIAFSGPGAVKIEGQVIRWMSRLMGYPDSAYGNLTSGGSIANLIAIKAARDFHGVHSANVSRCVVYCGEQTHHSIYKALHITGLHEAQLRKIPLTGSFRMDTGLLEQQMFSDRAEGLKPFLVVASAGTTDTGAIDPLNKLADLCFEFGAWFHVDAAYGGFFMLVDEVREKLHGIDRSDSVVLDPHKTLFLPFGSGAVLLRDRNILLASNSSKASYLVDTEGVEDISPADTGIELTRPNRGLRIWLPLQVHGIAPFRDCLREKIWLCNYFYEKVKELGFETGPAPDLSVCIFRWPGDSDNRINQLLIESIHDDGRVFLSSTRIKGILWLRCAVVSFRTHLGEINLCLDMIRECITDVANPDMPLLKNHQSGSGMKFQ